MTRPPASAPLGIAFLGNNSRRETLAKVPKNTMYKDEVKKEYYTMPMPMSKMPMKLGLGGLGMGKVSGIGGFEEQKMKQIPPEPRENYTTLSPAQKAKIEKEIAALKSKYLTTKNVKN